MGSSKFLLPVLFAALIAFGLYRRIRRSIGRQPLRRRATQMRLLVLTLVCALLWFSPRMSAEGRGYALAGMLLGAALAVFALRHTQFEATDQGQFYTPHLYIGIAVIALLVGRIGYRFVQEVAFSQGLDTAGESSLPPTTPLTYGFLYLTFGYYLAYLAGLLIQANRLGGTRREDATADP